MSWKLLLPTFLLFLPACNTDVGKLKMAGYQMNSSMSSSTPFNGMDVNLDFSTNFDVDGDDVPLTWDAFGGDYTEDFQIKLYTDSDCTVGEIDFGTTSSTSLSDNGIIDSLTDGTYYATVTAFNLDGESITSACSTDSIDIDSSQRVAQVTAGGEHTCILTTENNVYCVGKNDFGQIGNGTSGVGSVVTAWTQIDTTALAPGEYFTELSAGINTTCGVTNFDAAYCWGNNTAGQLGYDNGGTGIEASRNIPTLMDITNLDAGLSEGIKKVVTTGNTTCVYTDLSNVFCTGNDSNGQLGNNNSVSADQEILVSIDTTIIGAGNNITNLFGAGNRFCVTTFDGVNNEVYCWGAASNYALGDEDLTDNLTPTIQSSPPSGHLTAISLSDGAHGCGLSNSGSDIYCWGFNNSGQVGDNTTTNVQKPDSIDTFLLGAGENFVAIADTMGMEHSCALTDANNIWCWGRTDAGVLGNGTTVANPNQERPTTKVDDSNLAPGETFSGVELGADHTCATTSDSNLLCWGGNFNYQLGIGNNLDQSTPQKIDLDAINP